MPLYLIDTDDARTYVAGNLDTAFECPHVARAEAHRALGEMALDALPNGESCVFTAVVRHAEGGEVYEATLTLQGKWKATPPPRPCLPRRIVR